MDTTKCEALLCAVERGSFTAAALQLGYTPSGVTRMVDALEAELGLVIVRRTRSGVSLTPDGQALLPSLQAYVRSGRLLEERAGGLRGIVTGHIRIGTYYSIAAHWLPQIIAGFKEAYPGVTLSLREAGNRELKQLLKEGSVDCLFTSSRLVQGDWLPLGDDRIVAWVPRQWPQSKLEAMPLDTLASLPFFWNSSKHRFNRSSLPETTAPAAASANRSDIPTMFL